jgi:hypothetical protein
MLGFLNSFSTAPPDQRNKKPESQDLYKARERIQMYSREGRKTNAMRA